MKGIVIVNFEPEAFIYTEVANSTKTAVCFREKKMLLFRTRAAGVKLAGLLHVTLLETGSFTVANELQLLFVQCQH